VAILNGMSRCILSPSLLLAPTARTPSSALLALCASPFSFHSNFLLFIRPASPYTAWALAPILCPSPHMSTSSSLSFAPPPLSLLTAVAAHSLPLHQAGQVRIFPSRSSCIIVTPTILISTSSCDSPPFQCSHPQLRHLPSCCSANGPVHLCDNCD
jgi:hypothetical protein